MGYIYKITNTINNRCYIGITTEENPNDRWIGHKNAIKNGKGCPLLRETFNEYGESVFKFEVLIICFDEDLYEYEKRYIIKYNCLTLNGYNAHKGGAFGGNFIGKKHSEETKQIIRTKAIEYNSREDVKERSRKVAIEFNRTHDIGELMRKSEKWQKAKAEGRIGGGGIEKHNEETRKILSEKSKKYFETNRQIHSELMTKINGRKVHQYSLENSLLATFDSILLASKATGLGRRNIQANMAGRSKTAGGFIWKYGDKENNTS
jgi:group I intron endonuclease